MKRVNMNELLDALDGLNKEIATKRVELKQYEREVAEERKARKEKQEHTAMNLKDAITEAERSGADRVYADRE